MKKYITIVLLFSSFISEAQLQQLKITANNRYFQTEDGKPFFWMGDTGWLLFKKCSREEAILYLDTRQKQGFNVIQVMVLHELNLSNFYGDSALVNQNLSIPLKTQGKDFYSSEEYDFWDHVGYIICEAEKRGIYMALVPVWGSNINKINVVQSKDYGTFLANRYKNKCNIIWLNGGEVRGNEARDQWNTIGETIGLSDKNNLITYHQRGRNSSSAWFHNEQWLDFNMFQSGHRTYVQDLLPEEKLHYGEDNWKYVNEDYILKNTKPTIDGEPSYENIPYGLHKENKPYWQNIEIRRYAYWIVFAGCFGFTYGANEVMQFYSDGENGSYFPKQNWQEGLNLPGAKQMKFLKNLVLSKCYFDRIPDQSLVINNGEKYDRILVTKRKDYAMFYTFTGRNFEIANKQLPWKLVNAYWCSPKDVTKVQIHVAQKNSRNKFNPPGKKQNGNGWVLVLESADNPK